MKIRPILTTVALLLATFLVAKAQDLAMIPADAKMVGIIRGGEMNKIADFKKISELEMFQQLIQQAEQSYPGARTFGRKLLKSPDDVGLDLLQPIYAYAQIEEVDQYYTIAFSLSSEKNYSRAIVELMGLENPRSMIKKEKGFTYFYHKDIMFAWGKSMGIIKYAVNLENIENSLLEEGTDEAEVEIEFDPDEEETDQTRATPFDDVEKADAESDEQEEAEAEANTQSADEEEEMSQKEIKEMAQREIRMQQQQKMLMDVVRITSRDFGQTLKYDADFQAFLEKDFHIGTWTNSRDLYESGQSFNLDNMGFASQILKSLIVGKGFDDPDYTWNTHFSFRFEDEKLISKTEDYYTKLDEQSRLDSIYADRLNADYIPFMPQENLMGFGGIALGFRALAEEYYDSYIGMFKMSVDPNEMPPAVQDLLNEAIFDKEAFFNLLKKGGLVCMNGFSEQEVTYTTYEYDDDGYQKEVEKTKMQLLPVITMFLTSGDIAKTNKIIETLAGLGYISTDNDGETYTFELPEIKSTQTLITQDDLIIITNNQQVIEAGKRGLKRKYRMEKEKAEQINGRSYFFDFDLKSIMSYLVSSDQTDDQIRPAIEVFQKYLFQLQSADDNSNSQAGRLANKTTLEFRTKGNGLESLMNMINEVSQTLR